jgi:hypothetical protein
MSRTAGSYVSLKKAQDGWRKDVPYKIMYTDVTIMSLQNADPTVKSMDPNSKLLDEEDLELYEELADASPKEQVVETLFLLGNHQTGEMEWFHISQVNFVS